MYDINQMMDGVIEELYTLFKALVSGNYTGFCALYSDMMSKLAAMRDGIKSDADAKARQIEELKEQLARATADVDIPEGGGVIGGETVAYDFSKGASE